MLNAVKLGLAAVAAALLAQGALAQTADPARRAVFVALVEQNGCRISEADADRILPENGFTKEESRAIVAELMAENLASAEGDTLVLSGSAACP